MAIERVNFGGKEILLLGTAHISGESVEEVTRAIEEEKPDIVGVELDPSRLAQLEQGNKWQNTDISKVISSGQTHLFLLTLLLSNLQRSLGQKIGQKPGMEMMEAIRISKEKNLPIMLLDRDVNVTLGRAMQRMTLFEKLKLLSSVFSGFFSGEGAAITAEGIEKLKQKDVMNELMQQLGREMPAVKAVLVDERDSYIASSIMHSPGKKILAVVGAGHIEGVLQAIGKDVDITKISTVPKGADYMKIVTYAIPVIFIVLLGALFFMKGGGVTVTAIGYWFLSTGALAALGTLLARGHPLSILAAFLAAPFTTLHPLLAAGWVAGYVEAKVRNPKVKDFEDLANLNSLGDFTSNQVTRILLVVALANLGATIGVIIGFPLVASLFR
ncbi:MAG TPA: TraB/GumN family protein [Candidatus Diapherotrites archaeon]|uniref:TraB/GumN family protein n=1 Tax=Candidatus Iainarchaeum sp. TaxID=3101447 RepID=A0A7J4IXC2_9ARCH|nr:TraB/GumN family protein [Candidatus Diapherotrites archaeon]